MLAAVRAVRIQEPSRLVVAVPVASHEACGNLQKLTDRVHCLSTPEPFYSVSLVRSLLQTAAAEHAVSFGNETK
jgi:putative phosphoribosyl transferase